MFRAGIIVVAAVLLIAATPIPTPRPIISQQPQTESEASATNQNTNANDRGTGKAPLVVKLFPAQQLQSPSQNDGSSGKYSTGPDWFLVVVGILQLAVFAWQGLQLRRTVAATNTAAEAAKKSTESLTTIERAHVYPVIENHCSVYQYIHEAQIFYLTASDDNTNKPCGETCEISFKITNYGKTPAILKQAFVSLGYHPSGALVGVGIKQSILGSGQSTETLHCPMMRGLTRNEANHIAAYTGHLAFEGQITFLDIWENEYVTKFEFAWEPSAHQMQLCGFSTKKTNRDI